MSMQQSVARICIRPAFRAKPDDLTPCPCAVRYCSAQHMMMSHPWWLLTWREQVIKVGCGTHSHSHQESRRARESVRQRIVNCKSQKYTSLILTTLAEGVLKVGFTSLALSSDRVLDVGDHQRC